VRDADMDSQLGDDEGAPAGHASFDPQRRGTGAASNAASRCASVDRRTKNNDPCGAASSIWELCLTLPKAIMGHRRTVIWRRVLCG
jgi:hypothetical protein